MFPFFCALIFFYYICSMKNEYKIGKCISDKDIKFIKKYFKNTIILPDTRYEGLFDNDLVTSKFKITSIRKYNSYYRNFCYEVDVNVDMCDLNYFRSNEFCQKKIKKFNGWYRSSIAKIIAEELKYFGICKNDILISKIVYKKID